MTRLDRYSSGPDRMVAGTSRWDDCGAYASLVPRRGDKTDRGGLFQADHPDLIGDPSFEQGDGRAEVMVGPIPDDKSAVCCGDEGAIATPSCHACFLLASGSFG